MGNFDFVIVGVALASLWLWVASLPKFNPNKGGLKFWLWYIVPTGVLISAALKVLGIL